MRWPIAIPFLAVLGIAAVVYVGTQPATGTVEWHRRGYSETFHRGRAAAKLMEVGPHFVSEIYFERQAKKRKFHEGALVSAGFLGVKQILVTNRAPLAFSRDLVREMQQQARTADEIGVPISTRTRSNTVTVVAASSLLTNLDMLVRKLDVPETK
jgi:hypothetical protein